MKKITIIILFSMIGLSCYDAINDLLDELNATVPICVDSDASSGSDGRGWAHAVPTLNDALLFVQDKGEIWVKGTYTLSSQIHITKSISIYGGFNGTEQRRDERNSSLNITELNGGGTPTPYIYLEASNILLDGFTINVRPIEINNVISVTINNCKFINTSAAYGGALRINNSSATISQCEFSGCSATSTYAGAIYVSDSTLTISNATFTSNTANSHGGAIYFAGNSVATVTDSFFTSNSVSGASRGGAIYATSSTNTDIYLSHCTFTNNFANSDGGAITSYSGSGNVKLTISNASKFETNWTSNSNGGAVYCMYGTSAYIYNSDFISNGRTILHTTGASFGGAISLTNVTNSVISGCIFNSNGSYNYGGAIATQNNSDPDIKDSLFISNSTYSSGHGGAIYCNSGGAMISNCKFNGNTAGSGSGGALYLSSTATASAVVNSWFYNNEAVYYSSFSGSGLGGALYVNGTTSHTLVNLTFCSNKATGSLNNGGGIFLAVANNIYNTVFYNNTSDTGPNLYSNTSCTLYNCFYNSGLVGISITASVPPCIDSSSSPFVSTVSTENTFLYPTSVILDKGLSTAPGLPSTDLAGNPRVVGGGIDMGSYERQY